MSHIGQFGNQSAVTVQHTTLDYHSNRSSYPGNQFGSTSHSNADIPENTQQNYISEELVLL